MPRLEDGAGWHSFCMGEESIEGTAAASGSTKQVESDVSNDNPKAGAAQLLCGIPPLLRVILRIDEVYP